VTAALRAYGRTALRGAACTALLLCAGLDPCAARSAALREERSALEHTRERLERARGEQRPLGADERASWRSQWSALQSWLPHGPDEPRVLAELARWFEGPSIESIELLRREGTEHSPALPWRELSLLPPELGPPLELRAFPVQVRLLADHSDISRILQTLETRAAPLLVERLAIERTSLGLKLDAELIFVVELTDHAG
jgi:hypothetical protein